jgi:tetratricopeptide (TPR) repeat protein
LALTDPELDLLLELLADDPEDDVFMQVGEELVRRTRWEEARRVLESGLKDDGDSRGWALLARAALESGVLDVANAALAKFDTDPAVHRENAIVAILVLEASGRTEVAREAISNFLEIDPEDVVVQAALERLDAPTGGSRSGRTPDPFVSVDRAERYVVIGRQDRAVRVYRRLVFHNPDDAGIRKRLKQLVAKDEAFFHDDLSEELEDPRAVPPDFKMPSPSLSALAAGEDDVTEPGRGLSSETVRQHAKGSASSPLPSEFDQDDEEDTDTLMVLKDSSGEIAKVARKRKRRRRRSLINR